MAGFLIAGGALVATRGGKNVVCPQLNIGSVADIRRLLLNGGPVFQTGGASCGFWLALDAGDVVAYKVTQATGTGTCSLKLKRDHWECGGHVVAASDLAQYPVQTKTIDNIDAVIVDLRPPVPATT